MNLALRSPQTLLIGAQELQKKAEAQHREMQNLEGELQRKAEAQHREMQILEGKVEAFSGVLVGQV